MLVCLSVCLSVSLHPTPPHTKHCTWFDWCIHWSMYVQIYWLFHQLTERATESVEIRQLLMWSCTNWLIEWLGEQEDVLSDRWMAWVMCSVTDELIHWCCECIFWWMDGPIEAWCTEGVTELVKDWLNVLVTDLMDGRIFIVLSCISCLFL